MAALGVATPAAGAPRVEAAPAPVPCPVVPVPSIPPNPSPPPLTTHGTGHRTVGGESLDTAGLVVPPGAPPPPAVLSARSWVVADLDTGAVLGACGPHEFGAPASVQKLLLAETVLPKLDPAQVVEITQPDLDFEPGSSAVGLLLGGHYPVETLWMGLFLNSGNDAANVLARLGGGPAGVPGTIEAMNAEAHRLGAYDTHAVTPSGLDGPGQLTSAYDLALIARACFARDDFRKYDSTQRAHVPPQPPKDPTGYQIQNDNQLLYDYPGAMGGKNGFTDIARHTYVGAAERGGRRLVVTLLGAEHLPVRAWQQGAALLDWGFAVAPDARVGRLVEPGEADRPSPAPSRAVPAADRTAPAIHAARAWSGTAMAGAAAAAGASLVLLTALRIRLRRRQTERQTRQATTAPGARSRNTGAAG
jgi:D-alanyl-D-alanine carboxypeptidase (penicillin-binding protein 5/6)